MSLTAAVVRRIGVEVGDFAPMWKHFTFELGFNELRYDHYQDMGEWAYENDILTKQLDMNGLVIWELWEEIDPSLALPPP